MRTPATATLSRRESLSGRQPRTNGQSAATKWLDDQPARARMRDLRLEVILQSAARCFNRKGYHATTMEDIAGALGVSKAALYYYVKNKEEILFQCQSAAVDVAMEGLRRAREEADGESPPPPDVTLYRALRFFIEGMTGRLRGCVLLTEDMLSPTLHRQVVQRRDEYERQLRQIVADGIAAGTFAPCDPKLAVLAMLGAMNWIPRWYSPDGERTPQAIGEMFATYLVRGLGPVGLGPESLGTGQPPRRPARRVKRAK